MKTSVKIIILSLAFHIGCASAPTSNDTATAPEQVVTQEVTQGPETETAPEVSRPDLQAELLEMAENDQAIRRQVSKQGSEPDQELIRKLMDQDVVHANRLQEIIEELGQWPDAEIVGDKSTHAAWLIAQHANNIPGIQEFFLEYLRVAVDAGKSTPHNYAYLVDRVLFHQGKPQIYGTQFRFTPEDDMELAPVEDPENLNKRRAEMGLGTIEEYVEQMNKIMSPPPEPSNPPAAEAASIDDE